MIAARRRGLLLDRDGVINHDTGYVSRVADCHFIDGIFELARAFSARGFVIAIVTNQSGIGRGYYSEADFLALMGWISGEFQRRGIEIGAIYHCPEHPLHGIGPYRRDTPRRKPGPGMFLQAAAELSLDLPGSWTIGDKQSDIAAGRAAGVGTLVLLDPAGSETRRDGDVWIVPNLGAVAALLNSTPAG
jgi:D-glycero-D-manno-heptose 1,7-bisphosphate phosphatase